MKGVLFLALLILNAAFAYEADIFAQKTEQDISTISYSSALWNDANFSEVILYPQSAIHFNDKEANRLNANNRAKKVKVAAFYNERDIAFMMRWADDTINVQQGKKINSFADGFAIQFAQKFDDVKHLPYIGMGCEGRGVLLHLQKAARQIFEPNGRGNVYYQQNRNQTDLFGKNLESFDKEVVQRGSNDYEKIFIATGFHSMREIKDIKASSYARLGYKHGEWIGTLSRLMVDDYLDLRGVAAFPVAFAVFDGEKKARADIKNISQWLSVKLEGRNGSEALIKELSSTIEKADAVEGKKIVQREACSKCHQIEKSDPLNKKAPALYNVGGYSTRSYLRESLVEPSAVVIPGYRPNRDNNSSWYRLEGSKRISTMNSFSHLSNDELDSVVAYLKTLKVEVE